MADGLGLQRRPGYRWLVLAVGTLAQASTAAYFLGLAVITPALRDHFGLSLAQVGGMVGVISLGVAATLIPWGIAADRFGERWVMGIGLAVAAGCLLGAAMVRDPAAAAVVLAAAGASGAAVNAASGRAVLTWFPSRRRGLAMAVRQTSVPLGAAVAALALPAITASAGVPGAFAALAGLCALTAVAVVCCLRDAPGEHRERTPTPRPAFLDRRLWRLSVVSGLLVVPQFLGSVFLVELLHQGRGVSLAVAAGLLALAQGLGVAGRLGVGLWSDRVRSRLRPLGTVTLVTAGGFALAAAVFPAPVWLLAAVLVPTAAVAISWNGLAFTAAGELAPPQRVGAALAFQNTANYLSAALTPAIGGVIAQLAGWPAMLATAAAAAGLAWRLLRPLQDAA